MKLSRALYHNFWHLHGVISLVKEINEIQRLIDEHKEGSNG